MDRRNAIKNISGLAFATAAATAFPKVALAEEGVLSTQVDIQNNHGHSMNLSLSEVVQAVRSGGLNGFSIQGQSGHDHRVNLSQGDLLKLILDGEISGQANGSGHSHGLTIRLNEF